MHDDVLFFLFFYSTPNGVGQTKAKTDYKKV